MIHLNDWYLAYVNARYTLHLSIGDMKRSIGLRPVLSEDLYDRLEQMIEEMVDIRDAIFSSGIDIQTDTEGRRCASHENLLSVVHFIEEDNVFIITSQSHVIMMVNEEDLHVAGLPDDTDLIDIHLRRVMDINPDYFG